MSKNRIIILAFLLFLLLAQGQANAQNTAKDGFFDKIVLKLDTFTYTSVTHFQQFQGEKYFFFKSINGQDYCELTLYPHEDVLIEKVQLLNSHEFELIDSLRHFDDKYYRCKIKFKDLENVRYLSLIFSIALTNGKYVNYQIKLMPFLETTIATDNEPVDVFVDEEKVIELPCSNIYNVKMDIDPNENPDDEVKVSVSLNALKVKIKPKILGSRNINLRLKTIRPFINEFNQISYDLPVIRMKVNAKPNRIDFINSERSTVYYNPDYKMAEDIQFDYSKNLLLRKTYRIEDQPESGGNLIAELFTQSQVGNSDKVLCRLRTFSLHTVHDGYLYIKDGDKTRFITNFNIINKPRIDEVSIMRDGEDWTNNLAVYPGEKLEVRIKGAGLNNSRFQFDGAENIVLDTTRLSDEVAFYMLKIPVAIPKRKVNIFMNKTGTEYSLQIREYQKPSEFDFVLINYGEKNIPLSSDFFNKPVFYEQNIKDINILFDPKEIDENGKLNGKQHISIEVKIFNSRNDLLEIQTINNIVVCPSEGSPRSAFYDLKDCKDQTINLNDYLIHKTYSMDPFTQIFIKVSHNVEKHGTGSMTRQFKLILKKKYNFDVEVSFPAGLLTYKFPTNGGDPNGTSVGNFSGISIAFIAQLRFYEGENVNKFKPYSLGAGFIAIDAFNFNKENTNRDLGIVALGTLTPLQRGKLSFPLYLGGGFLVNQKMWFVLFGPGLRFSF